MSILQGTVIKSTGSWYHVRLPDGQLLTGRLVGKVRLADVNSTNPIAVGDEVQLQLGAGDEPAIIKSILPRRNYVVRQSPRRKHDVHLLASNIDQAVLFVTIVSPMLKQGFIDRFLLMTEPQNIPTVIVFNKSDLYDEEAMARYREMHALYTAIGYTVLLTAHTDTQALGRLKTMLKDKTSLLSGQSGVGKSTLINALQPQLELRVGDLSDYSGKGQHTTTFAEMHPLDFGGYLIDTPGIKSLAFNNLEPMDVAHNFKEFFALADQCRFGGNCTHRNEPKCAVKEAVEQERISYIRYANYCQILEEIEDQNYWERHSEDW